MTGNGHAFAGFNFFSASLQRLREGLIFMARAGPRDHDGSSDAMCWPSSNAVAATCLSSCRLDLPAL